MDEDPNLTVLVSTMDATAKWSATQELRRWERHHLALRTGQRLLDVGCGTGDAAISLADDLGSTGEVVGVDASEAMLAVARDRASTAACPTHFVAGDAMALDEPNDSFDAVRSERTLQWLGDPAAAIEEMARVLRPSGRIAVIDTDWSTLRLEVGDREISSIVAEWMAEERSRPSHVGNRLDELTTSAGFDTIAHTSVTQTWSEWDPDAAPAPLGCFSMTSLADDLVAEGWLNRRGADRLVATIHEAARRGQFSMTLTMHGVVAGPTP